MYDLDAGKKAPHYSFLIFMCLEQFPDNMFYARFDTQRSVSESDSEDDPQTHRR